MSADTSARTTDLPAIERVSQIAAVVASFSVVVSVFYDWGFMSALGLRFSEAPTSIADHVRSWLVWLPSLVIAAFGLLAIELLTRRIEQGMTEEEIIQSSANPKWTEKLRRSPFYFIGMIGVSTVVLWLFFGDRFRSGLGLGLIVCWLLFSDWVFRHPRVRERHSAEFRFFVYWAPPVMILVYFSGFIAATAQLRSSRPPDLLQMKPAQTAPAELKVRMLRSFERWLLVQDLNGCVLWVRSDDVSRIEGHQEQKPFRGIACWVSAALCPAAPAPSSKEK